MRTVGVLVVGAMMLGGDALAGALPRMNGAWSGEMRQIEVNAESSYPMTLKISGKTATSDYPTLNCGGTWTKIGERNGYSIYEEKIANRKGATCIDGMVMVKLDGGKLILGWFAAYGGAPSLAAASLEKAAATK